MHIKPGIATFTEEDLYIAMCEYMAKRGYQRASAYDKQPLPMREDMRLIHCKKTGEISAIAHVIAIRPKENQA